MTEEKFQEIKESVQFLVKAPWSWERCYEMPNRKKYWALITPESRKQGTILDARIVLMEHEEEYLGEPFLNENLKFLANAREYVQLLVEEVERLRGLVS